MKNINVLNNKSKKRCKINILKKKEMLMLVFFKHSDCKNEHYYACN